MMHRDRPFVFDARTGLEQSHHEVRLFGGAIPAADAEPAVESTDSLDQAARHEQRDRCDHTAAKRAHRLHIEPADVEHALEIFLELQPSNDDAVEAAAIVDHAAYFLQYVRLVPAVVVG